MSILTEGAIPIVLGAVVSMLSDPVTCISLFLAGCSLIVTGCACVVTYKSYKFQKAVAKSSMLNIKHKTEIQHLQDMTDTLSQVKSFIFRSMNPFFDKILGLKLKIIFHRDTIFSMNSYTKNKIENWMTETTYDINMDDLLNMFPKSGQVVDENYKPFVDRKIKELIDIQDDLFRQINDELWK